MTRDFGEPIDIKQFAADLMSLSSGDIEELTKELKEHWWKDFTTNDVCISPETLMAWAIIGAAKESDKVKADTNMQIAKWFKKYSELEHQHEQDEMWMECTNADIKFWKDFWDYITDKAVGDKMKIIEAIADNSHNWSEGYVKVEKSINDRQELVIKFTNSKGDKYTATWQPSDNYACWQTCGYFGDDYSGYLLFPTYNDDEYFCVYYNC
jgi:hypothetical protein